MITVAVITMALVYGNTMVDLETQTTTQSLIISDKVETREKVRSRNGTRVALSKPRTLSLSSNISISRCLPLTISSI
jgi:hypothetical protein